jgi:hypothetical protein
LAACASAERHIRLFEDRAGIRHGVVEEKLEEVVAQVVVGRDMARGRVASVAWHPAEQVEQGHERPAQAVEAGHLACSDPNE